MWYNSEIGIISYPQKIKVSGVPYPSSVFGDQKFLDSIEVYELEYEEVDERYYVKGTASEEFVDGKWKIYYEKEGRPLESIQAEFTLKLINEMDEKLRETDHLLIRKEEIKNSPWFELPFSIEKYREAIYESYAHKIKCIQNSNNIEEIIETEKINPMNYLLDNFGIKETSLQGIETEGSIFNQELNLVFNQS